MNTESSIVTVRVAGQDLMLLPEKAVFLPASDTLLIADAHIGKAATFRHLGVPVPAGTTGETLGVLATLVKRLEVQRIVFLGDFLHSARSHVESTMAAVTEWREQHASLELILVRGNHDERAGDPPDHLGIECIDEPLMHGDIALCHQPYAHLDAYVFAGHLHPCISIGGRAHDWHRLACFWFTQRFAVLPAFGAFTGMQAIQARRGERVFAATDERVFELRPKR
ncbi:MAG TPA: ligase-associated DNA damage response endonuclease PdeM [Burkholderiaceae bacterium]